MIVEELDLDVSAASSAIAGLGTELDAAFQAAGESLASSISDALAATTTAVEVTADASEVTSSVDEAIGAADTVVPVTADAQDFGGSIDEALQGLDPVVPIEADVSEIAPAIEDAVQEGFSNVSDKSKEATRDIGSITGATLGFGAAAGIARGETAGMAAAIRNLGPAGEFAAGSLLAVGAATAAMFSEAVKAESAQRRFTQTFGVFADQVNNIDIGGLDQSLSSLALSLGSDDDNIRNVAASLGTLAKAAGASGDEAARFAEQIVTLSARAVAANPTLGQVEDVADRMARALARGGPIAARFGISLSAAAVNTRALADSGKSAASELDFYDKAAAGAAIATEKFGRSTADIVAKGQDDPTIRLRELRQSIQETLEALGKPLVAPIFQVLESAVPLAESVGTVLGELANATLPAVAAGFSGLAPILGGVLAAVGGLAEIFSKIPAGITGSVVAFVALQRIATPVADALAGMAVTAGRNGLAGVLTQLPTALGIAGAAFTIFQSITAANAAEAAKEKQAVLSLRDALLQDAAAHKRVTDVSSATSQSIEDLITKNGDFVSAMAKSGVGLNDLRVALEGGSDSFLAFINELAKAGKLGPLFEGRTIKSIDELRQVMVGASPEATTLATGLLVLGDRYKNAGTGANELKRTQQDANKTFADGIREVRGLSTAVETLATDAHPAATRVAFLIDQLRAGTLSLQDFADVAQGVGPKTKAVLSAFAADVGAAQSAIAERLVSTIPNAADVTATALDASMKREADAIQRFGEQAGLGPQAITDALDKAKGEFKLGDIIDDLNKQATDIRNFFNNIADLASKGLTATAQTLIELGPQRGAEAARVLAKEASAQQQLIFEGSRRNLDDATRFGEQKIQELSRTLPQFAGEAADKVTAQWAAKLDLIGVTGKQKELLLAFINNELGGTGPGSIRFAAEHVGESIGGAYGEGITKGMIGQHEPVRGSAVQLVTVAEKAMIKKSGKSSPAKLFIPIGRSFGEGLTVGIKAAGAEVVRAAEDIVAQVAASIANTPPLTLPAQLAPTAAAVQPGFTQAAQASGTTPSGDVNTVTIYYPTPEPAAEAATRTLRKLNLTGG